ncbi:MAG: LysM peptidoglycan-binding domain-containing protein [Gammaproteobacteria bacterium]|nr:LysM peptidoglycan-binding domain-containing protein [Gammaproteobacteria bacterium]
MEAAVKQVLSPVILVLFLLSPLSVAAANADFPVPDNIRPAISFWTKVYTEVDTNSGFLHDAHDLSIIYRKLNRERNTINTTREKIGEDLKVLASGKRSGLTPSQQEVLDLWGANTSNARLEQASANIRWQLGQSDRFIAGIKRSGAYRNHIESVITEKGLPVELAVLPHVESSYHPGAYSSAAATGMWQFVRATAQRFMQVDFVVDQRLDPYTATYGAMELLEYNFNALGTWPLALTAYNHGANGIARAVRDVGTTDIGKIIAEYRGPRFGFASRNFYPQFLAAMEVDRRANDFYGSIQLDRAPDFQVYELDAFLNATDLVETLGVSSNALKRDNPALQPSVWSGTKRIPKGYNLKIDRLAFNGSLVAGINDIPASRLYGEQVPDVSYSVRRGDSLSVIAERYYTSVSELVAINQLRNRNSIRIGQTLLLPQQDGSVPTLVVNADGPLTMPATGRYEVRRGDTVSLIADRYRVSTNSVIALNNLNSRGTIFPGQILQLQEAPEDTLQVAENDPEDVGSNVASIQVNTEDDAINAGDPEQTPPILGVNSSAVAIEPDAEVVEQQLLADLQSDPSDYAVQPDNTIEIQAAETLGHYAEWLGIRAWDIRRLNNMVFRQPVLIGERLALDFSKVDKQNFEQERREFHRDLQSDYFQKWRIRETEEHGISRGDFLVNLARERSVPMWLFRQYNPDIDAGRIQIGQVVVFPVVERVEI